MFESPELSLADLFGEDYMGGVADAAALMGIDVRDKAFWRSALESIARDIDRFVEQAEAKR